ncbi:discoidin domain-containing protein [Acidaminobacter sp.]|uniref:discoidin domain-containing protein n=1 Tax=Acidaminobacter sp. TaxID=1872102 RepID=UPI00256244F3|nr:discoidin domain-containing protein [Acidaminobacter sp.]MDK9712306.1 discoidin domain-containing protein [Acidaminobacter sp.]
MINIPIQTRIHNEWTFVVKNVKTDEITGVYKGFNVVLDRFLIRFGVPDDKNVAKILVGDGAGTPSTEDTGLFSVLEDYSASVSILENTKNTLKVLYTAVVPSNELVGETLTEVGLSGAVTSYVYTHAMIEDSEGNAITIGPKSDDEEITIYSTFIFEIDTKEYLEYPRGNTRTLQTEMLFGLGNIDEMNNPKIEAGVSKRKRSEAELNTSNSGCDKYITRLSTTRSSASDGLYTLDAKRFGSSDANGEIREMAAVCGIASKAMCRIIIEKLPTDLFDGIQKTDEAVGSGNGSLTGFNLPWSNPQNAVIKVDGVTKTEVTDYTLTEFPKNRIVTAHDFFEAEVTGTMVTGKEYIFDGTDGTSPYAQMLAGENWVLDLKESKKYGFGSIGLRMTSTSYRWTSFDVDVSADGSSWTKVATAKAASATTWIDVAFDTVPKTAYRYIKMTANTVVGTGGARFTEVRFTATQDQIQFTSAPGNALPITASYKLGYIPKDSTKLLDLGLTLALTR